MADANLQCMLIAKWFYLQECRSINSNRSNAEFIAFSLPYLEKTNFNNLHIMYCCFKKINFKHLYKNFIAFRLSTAFSVYIDILDPWIAQKIKNILYILLYKKTYYLTYLNINRVIICFINNLVSIRNLSLKKCIPMSIREDKCIFGVRYWFFRKSITYTTWWRQIQVHVTVFLLNTCLYIYMYTLDTEYCDRQGS